MKNQVILVGVAAMLVSLVACSSKDKAPDMNTKAKTSTEVVTPSKDNANASAADAIDESNADQAMSDLENEINSDM